MRAAAVLLVLSACAGDGNDPLTDPPEGEAFQAVLTPEAVVGTDVVSEGAGTATFTWDGGVLDYEIVVSDMDDVTAAHIHGPALDHENAPIILSLFAPSDPTGTVSGTLVTGRVEAGSSQLNDGATLDFVLDLVRGDSAYVLVHTRTYSGGEIRGPIRDRD